MGGVTVSLKKVTLRRCLDCRLVSDSFLFSDASTWALTSRQIFLHATWMLNCPACGCWKTPRPGNSCCGNRGMSYKRACTYKTKVNNINKSHFVLTEEKNAASLSALSFSVEKLLSVCSSSCLPGGGSNTELALHCLHFCQGNTMVRTDAIVIIQNFHYSSTHHDLLPIIPTPPLLLSDFLFCFFIFYFFLHLQQHCMPHLFCSPPSFACIVGHSGDAAVLTALTNRRLPLFR